MMIVSGENRKFVPSTVTVNVSPSDSFMFELCKLLIQLGVDLGVSFVFEATTTEKDIKSATDTSMIASGDLLRMNGGCNLIS